MVEMIQCNRYNSYHSQSFTIIKQQFTPPPFLPGITRVTTLKVLGVTISDKLSVSAHVQNIISSCAQLVHAIRTLLAHGMCQEAIQTSFPECCRRQTDVRSQRLVGFCYGNWSAANGGSHPLRCALWSLDGFLYSAQCKRRNANGATQRIDKS